MHTSSETTLERIVSLCKRRGFVYQSAEIYGGINGMYDFGHLGTLLKQNIRDAWISSLKKTGKTILFFEGALIGSEPMWDASGHTQHFHDPMVDCLSCKKRYRTDEIDLNKACPHCGKTSWTEVKDFNMMFKTQVGASGAHALDAYLRPETAQSIFVNFKNIISTNRVKLPFGVAQIGKAFRNEINPKHFLFRMREFEQMELEWFCNDVDSLDAFNFWSKNRLAFHESLGINPKKLRLREYEKHELAHYSQATNDIEYHFPFGWKELEGIAHRGTFDLSNHNQHSGKDLSIYDEERKQSSIPTVIETSVGVDRLFLTLLFDAYQEQNIEGETRIVLSFKPSIAPIKAAFLPLSKKLSEPMHHIFKSVQAMGIEVEFDESGTIGKRYRRQDEIGTPLCFTYDFESSSDNAVTVRDRDTMKQTRIAIDQIQPYIKGILDS